MAERGKCYIYGSMHIKMSREDILRELLGREDYIILEEFNVGDERSLVRQRPNATLIVEGASTYFAILNMLTRTMDKWYRMKGKPPFLGRYELCGKICSKIGEEDRGG